MTIPPGMFKMTLVFSLTIFSVACSKTNESEPGSTEGEWLGFSTSNFPDKRHESSFVVLNNKGYLIGGRGYHQVDVLDINSKSWSPKDAPPLELNHFQAVVMDNEIWLAGGFSGGFPHETPVGGIAIFNPANNQWRQGASIPIDRRRGSAGAVVHNGKLYLVCGITDGHWAGHVAWFDEYDPATGQWKQLPDAPHARDHFQAVVINNKLYVAGGRRSSQSTSELFNLTVPEVDVFDFGNGSWSTLASDKNIPTPRAGTAAVNLNGNLVIIGGETGSQNEAHRECESYNPATGKWISLKPLITGRHGTQAFVADGSIFISAGSANRGGGPELNSTEQYVVK